MNKRFAKMSAKNIIKFKELIDAFNNYKTLDAWEREADAKKMAKIEAKIDELQSPKAEDDSVFCTLFNEAQQLLDDLPPLAAPAEVQTLKPLVQAPMEKQDALDTSKASAAEPPASNTEATAQGQDAPTSPADAAGGQHVQVVVESAVSPEATRLAVPAMGTPIPPPAKAKPSALDAISLVYDSEATPANTPADMAKQTGK